MPDRHWLHALFESVDAKRTADFLSFLTDDALFRYGSNPAATGRIAIGTAVEQFFASIRSCSHRLTRFWEDRSSVVCQGEVQYVRLDGRSVTLPFCNVFELRDEKISRYEIYIDPTPLMAP